MRENEVEESKFFFNIMHEVRTRIWGNACTLTDRSGSSGCESSLEARVGTASSGAAFRAVEFVALRLIKFATLPAPPISEPSGSRPVAGVGLAASYRVMSRLTTLQFIQSHMNRRKKLR